MKGLVICMRAIPGSGKSTFAKKLAEKYESEGKNVVILSADNYFYEIGGGEYKFDFRLLPKAHGACFRKFIESLRTHEHDVVIIDNTNLSSMELSPYQLGANAYDYDFVIKQVEADPSIAAARNVHGVPADRYAPMVARMKESLPPWWKTERYQSGTSESGNPTFEEIKDEIKKARMRTYRMEKFSDIMSNL